MPEIPWVSISDVQPNAEYLALVSCIPRKGFFSIFSFLRQTYAIQDQLRKSEGLLGYSLRTQLIGKKAWTLSAWKDEAALTAFVRASPHADTMKNLRPLLGKTKFVKWKI